MKKVGGEMSIIGDLIWLLCGGLVAAICWVIAGILLCITIIGIPFGVQCFKIAGFVLAPFGREIVERGMGPGGLIGNILWVLFLGIELAITHLVLALALAVTIIGIPFALQHLKLARLSLMPFGAKIC
jgi:uncharacterized membrane protein YccF (DUF307 family)